MSRKELNAHFFSLLRTSVNTLIDHPIILYPLCIAVFIQLLALEIIYFAPRFPLSVFFGPMIRRLWNEAYLHYPYNFMLLPKLFYYTQILIYIFIGGFLNAVAISIIAAINNDKRVTLKAVYKENLPFYIHIFVASLLSLGLFSLLSSFYRFVVYYASQFELEGKVFLYLKKMIIYSGPYANLILGVFVTTALAFLIQIIVIEKKKIFSAIVSNFQTLNRSFWFVFSVVLVPTLFYVPLLLIRSTIWQADTVVPGIHLFVIIVGLLVTLGIDATVFTATTTYYLFLKENK